MPRREIKEYGNRLQEKHLLTCIRTQVQIPCTHVKKLGMATSASACNSSDMGWVGHKRRTGACWLTA